MASALQAREMVPAKVNNHIHTPYSFSAFESVGEAVDMALKENVKILGINDFYVTDGYEEFIGKCTARGIFPLLNIELIGISQEEQKQGIRVNDPNNPGRTYISGKGLAHPSIMPGPQREKLERVIGESNRQVTAMVTLLNDWFTRQGVDIRLSTGEIMRDLAVNLLRERHVAKMVRLKVEASAGNDRDYFEILTRIYGGIAPGKERGDIAGTEEELRARLLKSGAPAFVPEDEKAFLPLEEITGMIRDAGGIPTYPLLLDGAGGGVTEFEADRERLLEVLQSRGFRSVEFIPLRNRPEMLRDYVEFFYGNGFSVSFGTEHNTTAMRPLTVSCLAGSPLDRELVRISYLGAAVVAAHQYRVAREGADYEPWPRGEMEKLGDSVFRHYFGNFDTGTGD
ncbi:MAG: hypothetical protein EHM46_03115 [Bacteroidetes bacterium]|nr:MAG: hypothetical protein EHM46_03115 [Bacteroidota bacterium]